MEVVTWECSGKEALTATFLEMDERFGQEQEREWQERVRKVGAAAAGQRKWPGCTALAVLVLGHCILVANAGVPAPL